MVDVKAGRQPMDEDIARRLRQAGKRVLLVVNKCDTRKDEQGVADFYALGQQDMVPTSVEHRRGLTRPDGEAGRSAAGTAARPGRPPGRTGHRPSR